QRRSEMAAALERSDHDAARKAAHSVKGMAGSMGARALQHLAERMQHADDSTFDGLVASFEQLADQTLAAFAAAWTN
ncbi:MAG: Hpt domain-containing protein, partial [Ilumatobacteraceae bacterium]